ncbi:MAG: aspartate aminotransferase family protein [Gemmatimonadaceae bacterium]
MATSVATPITTDVIEPSALGPRPTVAVSQAESRATESALLPVYKRSIELVGGEGVHVVGADGARYLDFVSGIAVNALGYADAGLREAMHAAVDAGLVHVSNLFASAPGERLARALVEKSFADYAFFCNSGAEANEGAFKLARRWARSIDESGAKHEIIALRGSFHGRLFATLAATDRPAYRLPFRPLAGGIAIAERDASDLETMIDAETTAAVILEPVQGEGGVRVLDHALIQAVRRMCTERQVALIFDEIQCGLGRTGTLFAYEQTGVAPDLLTLAKPLAGGLPMGAVLATKQIAAAVQPGDHGTTFGGGPFVASVAEHVLSRLSDPRMLAHVRETGAWLGAELGAMADRSGRVRAVRGVGFMWGVDVVDRAADVVKRALDLGLLVCSAGDHTIRLLPPLVATRDELARGVALLEQAIAS